MNSIDVLGPTTASIIKICWWLCGISFVYYAWKSTNKKMNIGMLLFTLVGPILWLSVLFMYLCRPLVKKHKEWKESLATASILGALLIFFVGSAIIMFCTSKG